MELTCPWETAQYFVYSSNIPTLFFYSHAPAILVALLVGILVFFKSNKSRVSITLLAISILFSAWSVFDLILWATNKPDVVMLFWSLQILFEPLIYLMSFCLVYFFTKNTDLPFSWKTVVLLLYSPIIIFLATNYNLQGVNLADCTAIEGFIAQYFTYIVELLAIIAIVSFVVWEHNKLSDLARKKEILIFTFGVILFLFAFSWGNIIGSFTNNWTLAQGGLIGMPIFIAFLAYMMVKFKTFNIKVIGTQILIFALGFSVLGVLFIRKIENVRVIIIFTLVFVVITGYLLIRSVKKEVWQREQLQKLNMQLQESIKQRASLVHLITHKVKGSFTRTKFIFAGMLDGTFGDISPEIKKMAEQGLEFDNGGIETVDLVLNVDNMQNGFIKYDMQPTNFKDIVLKSIEDKKLGVEAKGLKIETDLKDGEYKVLGDAFWLKETINNLIENSIKYTKAGKIILKLKDGNGKILFSINDTGMGITEEDKKHLFTEGGRGKDSVRINVDSTGYGLYSVKLIIEAHKGRVWAESEGTGLGSSFFIELPSVETTA